jgi:hypothetical protein
MKPETNKTGQHRYSISVLLIPAFLFFCNPLYSQKTPDQDTLLQRPFTAPLINPKNIRLYFIDTSYRQDVYLIPFSDPERYKTVIFLDSLKSRASKKIVTRKLFDFLIISPDKTVSKSITRTSDVSYIEFAGKKIRKIEISRLSVFGSNIESPAAFNPNGLESLLNKTHINTSENIIRKNLLFSAGDSISPLTLSDNERLLRDLPFINDAKIIVVPVSESEADIMVLTKDIYSLGAGITIGSLKKGSVSLYDKNIFGMGHEFRIEVPYNSRFPDSPGFGAKYLVNNINKTFINLDLFFYDGLGEKTYGFDLSRKLISSTTKYAGGVSIKEMFTTEDFNSSTEPEPLKYNLQDYWISRSFLINPERVSRFIIGARYKNNNVFNHPVIQPDSYHRLQKNKIFLGSVALSVQKFYKTNLIYGYGRTEDIPYGGLIDFTAGREISEFKQRTYLGTSLSIGHSIKSIGYFYSSAGFAAFIINSRTEQGMLLLRTNFISNMLYLGRSRIRNFVNVDYTRGFDRYSDEYLSFNRENGFSGFRNDTVGGTQRLSFNIESVLFSPVNFYGFKFAFFGFTDFGFLFDTNEHVGSGDFLSSIGVGIRIRNDNMVFNTLQVRLGFFPNLPEYSRTKPVVVSGEQLLSPYNFEPGMPSLLPYK